MLGKTVISKVVQVGGDCGCPVQSYVEGVHEKNAGQKKVWEKFVAFVVKCRETRNIKNLDGSEPGCNQATTIVCSLNSISGQLSAFRVRGD